MKNFIEMNKALYDSFQKLRYFGGVWQDIYISNKWFDAGKIFEQSLKYVVGEAFDAF